MTTGVMSESVDIYDSNNLKIIKKRFQRNKLIQPFIGYLEKSNWIYISNWLTSGIEAIINCKTMQIEK